MSPFSLKNLTPTPIFIYRVGYNDSVSILKYCSRKCKGIRGKVKLPESVVIPEDKFVRYLLLPRQESDKSQFLGIAGYTLATWSVLAHDLYNLAKTHEISDTTTSPYGIKWEVQGTLAGPHGQILHVVTVWITLEASGATRFVTLFPDRERHQ